MGSFTEARTSHNEVSTCLANAIHSCLVSGGNDCDRQSINIITANPNCREGQSIVDQVLELCDANGDAMVSVDEVKDCEDQYCGQFGITNCPDQDELKIADQDQDGFLSPDEIYYFGLHVTNPA